MKKKCLIIAVTLTLVMGMAGVSFGAVVDWADWTAATIGIPGSASGAIGSVSVTYTGEVYFAYTSPAPYFWTGYNGGASPFISATVENDPTTSDYIALTGGNPTVNTITFSEAVTNPVMAISSLGTPNISLTYNFNQAFQILSEGPGWFEPTGTLTDLGGIVLQGLEGNGTIQFLGTNITSISWTVPTGEAWQGFTVGLPSSFNPVPLPGAVWLLGSGLVGLGFLRRKRKTAA